jgi:hypothetical protein
MMVVNCLGMELKTILECACWLDKRDEGTI